MRENTLKIVSILLLIAIAFSVAGCGQEKVEGPKTESLEDSLSKTIDYLHSTVTDPRSAQVGGEWAVVDMALANISDDAWFQKYIDNLSKRIDECNGILDEKKYTEYSRAIIALSAIGKDASAFQTNKASYDMVSHLTDKQENGDYCTYWQGNNGVAYALMAVDSGNYLDNQDGMVLRAAYIDHLISAQRQDGSWAIAENVDFSDVDISAMIIQALAPYYLDEGKLSAIGANTSYADLKSVVDKSVDFFASKSGDTFGNVEACTQVVAALSDLKIDAKNDSRFGDIISQMFSFYIGDGKWYHTNSNDGKAEPDQIATEQACYALLKYVQLVGEKSSGTSCSISISCKTALDNLDKCDEAKQKTIPLDGWIVKPYTVTFKENESVYDLLVRVCKENKIQYEFNKAPGSNSVYIEGINNLYEFDITSLSGWMYKVNDWFPNYSLSNYIIKDGDIICIEYTCDLGNDIGGAETYGKQ